MSDLNRKIIWPATVVDVKDPLMINRVRVQFDTENNLTVLQSVPDVIDNKKTKTDDGKDLKPEFRWTNIDPFCCLPLLPLFINVTPKEKESVNVFFTTLDYKYGEQYYIQGPITSPKTLYREDGKATRLFAAKDRLKTPANLKNPTNDEYYNSKTKGVFPEPGDNAILGRGTTDVVARERDLILRAGKSTTVPNNINKDIVAKTKRSFIQLSDFSQRILDNGEDETFRLVQDIVFVKSLIEWSITNPENNNDLFSFTVSLYNLTQSSGTTTQTLQKGTSIPNSNKSLVSFVTYNLKSSTEVIDIINTFIQQCNDGQLNFPPNPIVPITNQFPIVFRPSESTYKYIQVTDNTSAEYKNVSNINSKISFKAIKDGFGLIFSKNVTGQQTTVKTVKTKQYETQDLPITYNILGGDKLLLLSHESKIPSKENIVLDETTMLGIDGIYLTEKVLPYTDPMVRGDELMKFLNIIVKFLVAHVHPFPGLPPVPTATDGTLTSDILSQLQNASNTILNQNIRIN